MKKKKTLKYVLIALVLLVSFFGVYMILTLNIPDMSLNNKEKLILIGIDAADMELIHELVDKGELPNFENFFEEGSYGILHSPSCYSPISWTEILTGKTKEKHGIYDYLTPDRTRWNNRYDLKSRRVWDYLNDNNLTVGVLNHYFTWPAEEVNGFMISHYTNGTLSVYPPTLQNVSYKRKYRPSSMNSISETCDKILWLFKFKPEFYTFMDTKLYAVTSTYWKYFKPEIFNITSEEEVNWGYGKIVRAHSKWDECLGRIELSAEDYDIIIVSDHGLGANPDGSIYYTLSFEKLFSDIGLSNEILGFFRSWLEEQHNYPNNLEGEYTAELLAPSNPESIDKIKKIFIELSYLDGTKVFENVTVSSKFLMVYANNSKLKSNPIRDPEENLLLEYNIPVIVQTMNMTSTIILTEHSGDHPVGEDGIILAKGPNIKRNFKITNASTYDITPTILYLYGIPIPDDMDGHVLKEMIKPKTRLKLFLRKIFKTARHNSAEKQIETQIIANISEPEDKERIDLLRRLGYLV